MGGATPITWRLLRAVLPTSVRAVMRAVTVFEGFCWLAVTTRPLTWNNKHYCIMYTWDYCERHFKKKKTKLESFCVLGQQFDNHVFDYIITITVTQSCCESGHCHYMEAPCIRVNRLSCRMLTCLWELAVPPSGSELCTTVVGGSTSALDTGAPELTWGKGNQEHIWRTDGLIDPMKDLRRNRTMTQKNYGV